MTRSSWLRSSAIATLVLVVEARWASLGLSAIVNGSPHFAMDLPLLAFVLPGVASLLVSAAAAQFPLRRRLAVLVPVVVLGGAISAGLISELSVSGSLTAVAFHPWTVAGHVAMKTMALAWLVAGVSWVRGATLGSLPISYRATVVSAGVGAGAFVVLIVALPAHPAGGLTRAAALAWFVGVFVVELVVLAVIRERDAASDAGATPVSSGSAWLGALGVLAVPVVGLSTIALAARAAAELVPAVARWFVSWLVKCVLTVAAVGGVLVLAYFALHGVHAATAPTKRRILGTGVHPSKTAPARVDAGWLLWVGIGLGVVALSLLALWLVRRVPRGREGRATEQAEDLERDSIFSLSRLLGQLRALLAGVFSRRRAVSVVSPAVTPPAAVLTGVRLHYRRLLVSAHRAGLGKLPTETTNEFLQRVRQAAILDVAPLARLTGVYDGVRYGGERLDAVTSEAAEADAQALVSSLAAHALASASAQAAPVSPAPRSRRGRRRRLGFGR